MAACKPGQWAALVLAVLLLWPVSASALVGDREGAFGIDGSLTALAMMMDKHHLGLLSGGSDSDMLSINQLRLIAAGRPSSRLTYEAHLVTSYTYTSAEGAQGSANFLTLGGKTRYRAVDTAWYWRDWESQQGILWADRLNAKISLGPADLTVGRQAVTFGKAYFWNPLDVFLPFDPRQFDREYKAGVDALRLDFYLGDFTGITLLAVGGREVGIDGEYVGDGGGLDASWYGSALLARAYTTLAGWDLAVQGGKIYGGYQLGGGFTGEIGPLQARAEAAYFWAHGSRPLPAPLNGDLIVDHLTLVLGTGHRWDNTLSIEVEYLYNGAGDPDNLEVAMARFAAGTTLHLGRHLLGATASYELTPLALTRLVVLYSLSDNSILLQPSVTVSVADNIEAIFGISIGLGANPTGDQPQDLRLHSEFGSYADYYFAQFKFYF